MGGDHGILAEIIGGPAYLAKTTKQYIAPVRLTALLIHQGQHQQFFKSKKTAEWEDLKESHAVLVGARLSIAENIRNTLDTTYHEQIADTVLGYTTVALKDYFNHLTANWCKLTTTMRSQMKTKYFRG